MSRSLVIIVGGAALLGGVALSFALRESPGPTGSGSISSSLADVPPQVAAERLATELEPANRRQLVRALARAPDAVARLQAAWTSNGDGAAREEMLIQAGKKGGGDAAQWLAGVAAGEDKYAARAGAALGSMKSRSAAGDLARIAASDAPILARANAAQALGRSGDTAYAGEIAGLATNPSQPLRVREEAALALRRVGDGSQVPALAAALDDMARDASPDAEQLRITYVQALGKIGTPAARDALERHASRDLSPNERAFVEFAVGKR